LRGYAALAVALLTSQARSTRTPISARDNAPKSLLSAAWFCARLAGVVGSAAQVRLGKWIAE
jgi:hypothetical protein